MPVEDTKSGPTNPKSTVLSEQEEQVICEFRRVSKFSLDDIFHLIAGLDPSTYALEFAPLFEASWFEPFAKRGTQQEEIQ